MWVLPAILGVFMLLATRVRLASFDYAAIVAIIVYRIINITF